MHTIHCFTMLLTKSLMYGSSLPPKRSVDSRGSCAGMLSMEEMTIPGPDILKDNIIKCYVIKVHD